MKTSLIDKYSSALCEKTPPLVRDPRLLMEKIGDINIYYAPFECINPDARVVLVGITPGPTQMINANNEARRTLQAGKSGMEAIRAAKNVGAFSGELLRRNLINQLNHWGFHDWLGIKDSSELFSTFRHMLHTTSLLRYPVFIKENDYRGTPDMIKNPLLRKYLFENFVIEVEALKNAVFVGLGPQVQKILERLIQERILESNRVIGGMLHPSGNCTYRINYLIGDRSTPKPHATNPLPYDIGRRKFQEQFLST
ncbi:hypothetical protein [Methyloglobulus sp.]|uniref:hypothetical protein n=1 Tax=Methyloglobulus sp. TaxID=2518622 RepID=UPI0032B7759E